MSVLGDYAVLVLMCCGEAVFCFVKMTISHLFWALQDVCKSCGSFGKGDEGRLIVCTQCGQCYHPYCVTVKVNFILFS